MLIESRTLIFPEADLIQALGDHDSESNAHRLCGSISAIELLGPDAVRVSCRGVEDDSASEVVLDGEFLLAAMLRYCIRQKIPVAQKAAKRVELVEGELAICMSMGRQTDSAAGKEYYVLL